MNNDLSTLGFDEMIEAVRHYQEVNLSENDRIEFWQRIQDGYCVSCGTDDPRCQCVNDE